MKKRFVKSISMILLLVMLVSSAIAVAPALAASITVSSKTLYKYDSYGIGDGSGYFSRKYIVSGSVGGTKMSEQISWDLIPSSKNPSSGSYSVAKGSALMAKVLYYGTKSYSGSDCYFSKFHTDFQAGKQYIIVDLAAAKVYGKDYSMWTGTNRTVAEKLVQDLIDYCKKMPVVPYSRVRLSQTSVSASAKTAATMETTSVQFTGHEKQKGTISLPAGVKLYNYRTNSTSAAGAKVTLKAGDNFKLIGDIKSLAGKTSTLTVSGVNKNDYSAYILTSGNSSRGDLCTLNSVSSSATATLNITWSSIPKPSFTTQPNAVTVNENSTASFDVLATGTGIKYQWQYSKDGKTWYNVGKSISGVNSDTLSFKAVSKYNGYQYRCKVTDVTGSAIYSDPAKLTIKLKLKITSNPADVTAKVKAMAVFSVAAKGEGLKYQWQYSKNGTKWANVGNKIPSAKTDILRFAASSKYNNMQYRCVVVDENGKQAISSPAKLCVVSSKVENVGFSKKDIINEEELPGAHMKVTDEDGNVVDEWVSTKEPHIITHLITGKTYILTETQTADGYVTANSVIFTVVDENVKQAILK